MAEFNPNEPKIPSEQTDAPPATEPSGNRPPKKRFVKRTAFYITATIIALILLLAAVMKPLVGILSYAFSLLSPLIIGGIIAYLCDPILEMYEYRVFRRLGSGSMRRGLSLLFTVITAFGIVIAVCAMMIPQLLKSINELFANYESYINSFLGWLQSVLNKLTENLPGEVVDISDIEKLTDFFTHLFGDVENLYTRFFDSLQTFIAEGNILEKTWTVLLKVFNSVKNLFLGMFIAFYLLASKEKRIAQFRKFRRAMFSEKTDGRIEEIIALTDKSFGGFIYGKILDSLVIGVLTFVLLTLFEISPYNLLISTFIGITNIIPVFGPFIGAIPSFFIVLISNPDKAFLFLVLILIIQQLDGNIIGPKILGDNTGVSSLCVIIAIAICSTLWGVAGMILGVPIFAVAIELIKQMLEKRLAAKGEPTDTQEYYPDNAIGNAELEVHYEHSSLRYRYEHSKFKPRFEKWRNNVLNHLGRQVQATPPTENVPGDNLPSPKVNAPPVVAEKSQKSNKKTNKKS
ncbi:MAG: AI-2E family transporter [Ruminococcaceae bacterium]|nr:AI-2E family transporter [Oscillospiraceae bacterium]